MPRNGKAFDLFEFLGSHLASLFILFIFSFFRRDFGILKSFRGFRGSRFIRGGLILRSFIVGRSSSIRFIKFSFSSLIFQIGAFPRKPSEVFHGL